ncbi:hypothetical protein [Microbacterium esteraromaticum]|uniref:hypothetical protein n=1 Tax=Microbacterium esteraromaticum TaxID=57043 RepID=UPI0019D35D41|nr:hypothetical protein [Microbacterium esteraromaticum]MBN7792397.1 hypothetical protein [Microbacterium esteraromaticum]
MRRPAKTAPLAPWRVMFIAAALVVAAICGIPAANPVFNGADLGVFIALALFIAAFTYPGRDQS